MGLLEETTQPDVYQGIEWVKDAGERRAFQTKRAAGRNSVDESWHGFGIQRKHNEALPRRPGLDQGRL